jgi:hypothetical protein
VRRWFAALSSRKPREDEIASPFILFNIEQHDPAKQWKLTDVLLGIPAPRIWTMIRRSPIDGDRSAIYRAIAEERPA